MAYRFESFVLDPNRGLFEAGEPVGLEPQVLKLLTYLIDNRDRIVSHDELNAEIWGGRTVSEAALSSRIRAVRRALGDTRAKQAFVRTHPKRGFQFVAPVEVVEDRPAPGAPAGRPKTPGAGRRRMIAIFATLVLVVLMAGSGAWWLSVPEDASSGTAPPLSIAVLPFDSLSGDPEQAYFADAFTEDLITDLSRIRDAFVIARRTSFTYKERSVDVAKVANELGVRYVLEGSVRRRGDRVRVNAQLIDGQTNRHIWSDRFEGDVTEIFSGKHEVTGQIASALKAELREADLERQGPPDSLEAWDYALKGNVLLVRPERDFRKAKDLLEKAIALDPTIASAWSGLAFVHFAASFGNIPGVTEPNSQDLSLEAAQRAVALDPKNAEGHWMVGVGYARNGRTDLAWPSCETAMNLNPNNDCGYVCAGLTKMAMGKPTEAIPYFKQSLRLNPRFRTFTKHKYMGLAYVQSGQDNKAIDMLNRALASSPKDRFAHLVLSSALAHQGRTEKASAALEHFRALSVQKRTTVASLRESHSWLGPGFERVLKGLRQAGLPERRRK
jgi:TolB-like protein/DNA-binding winged helix-turn-helix (wHTH) protein/Tfp pilus assembly protein PilF